MVEITTNTPRNGLRVPELTDAPNIVNAVGQLATDVDSRLFGRYATPATRDLAIPTPEAGDVCYVTSYNLPMIYYSSFWGFFPGTPVASLYQSATQNVLHITYTAISLDAEDFDSLSGHSIVTNNSRYMPPVQGRYSYIGAVSYSPHGAGRRWALGRKNGVTLLGSESVITGTADGHTVPICSQSVVLNGSTDYLDLIAFQNSTATLTTGGIGAQAFPSLQIFYMGPA